MSTAKTFNGPQASLVWDGVTLKVPEAMGTPRGDQLASTNLDNLIELCGRVCYDSCGTGRNSTDYHQHIIDVGHLSVQEHANITLETPDLSLMEAIPWCVVMLNRPGVYTRVKAQEDGRLACRVTLNVRSIREFDRIPCVIGAPAKTAVDQMRRIAGCLAPMAMGSLSSQEPTGYPLYIREPETEEEIWASFYIDGVSRGESHEQVRHRFRTAVSQRSTRYVNESESVWCPHPLMRSHPMLMWVFHMVQMFAEKAYDLTVASLQGVLQKQLQQEGGMSELMAKTSARKQARGAARGLLGNALETSMIFSASLAQWKHMLVMRASDAADAEIRCLFGRPIFEALSTRWPEFFQGWTTRPATDGCGLCVIPPPEAPVQVIETGPRS